MGGDRIRHQTEHAYGRIQHDKAGHLDHGIAHAFKEFMDRFARIPQRTDAEAEGNGKYDNLQHISVAHGFYGVDGGKVHK